MLRLGPSPPALRACCAHAWCEYSESVDMAARRVVSECDQNEKKNRVPSTVGFRRANSGSASLNARISVGHTKVKSLDGLIKCEAKAGEDS